eukprot:TRINITY_DN35027_c0_g1_i2.p1 TRINITY_DN35027_c0_g1~~TRINITY_DN35027_c0_g1_i2.p1  ORF type:complete len:258 (+),score=28.90 TRINITY_DN35027_c0_g1_i2:33-776(+)
MDQLWNGNAARFDLANEIESGGVRRDLPQQPQEPSQFLCQLGSPPGLPPEAPTLSESGSVGRQNQTVSLEDEQDPPTPPRAHPPYPASAGSRGHPEFCQRPCDFFVKGNCQRGFECQGCHMEHLRRPFRLDKQRREMLRSTPRAAILNIAMLAVRKTIGGKIAAAKSSAARKELSELQQKLLDSLEAALAEEIRADPEVRTTMNPKLEPMFSKLDLVAILRHAFRDVQTEVVEEFRRRMQSLMESEI